MDEIEIEHERVTLHGTEDGSNIVQDRYRRGPIAPWTIGLHEVICGSCAESISEHEDLADARIALLEHQLLHAKEEMQDIWRWVHSRGKRA